MNVCNSNSMESRVSELVAQGHLDASARLIAQLEHSNKAMAKVALQAVMDAICLLRDQGMWSVHNPRAARLWSVAQMLNGIADCPEKLAQGGAGNVGPEGNTARACAAAPVHDRCWNHNSSDGQHERGGPPGSAHADQLGGEAWNGVTCPSLRAAGLELYTLLGCIRGTRAGCSAPAMGTNTLTEPRQRST